MVLLKGSGHSNARRHSAIPHPWLCQHWKHREGIKVELHTARILIPLSETICEYGYKY